MEHSLPITRVLKAPTKPLAEKDFASLQFPFYASYKKDGIRIITAPHGPLTQTFKSVPNHHIASELSRCELFLDGELVTLTGDEYDDFHTTQSKVMSREGKPDFCFLVFDCFSHPDASFELRLEQASVLVHTMHNRSYRYACMLQQKLVSSTKELRVFEQQAFDAGQEGVMLRHPRGLYKSGRSTEKEGFMLKVKRFTDDEAVVTQVVAQQENCNPATLDARGLTKRSKHKANLKPKACVGKLICNWRGLELCVDGFTQAQREAWWKNPKLIVGKTITFTYQAHGTLHLPRQPKFKGIRLDV